MAKKKIITNLQELRKPCQPINDEKLIKNIIKELEETLADYKEFGIGLSANQIGYSYRVCILRLDKTKVDLVNPKIVSKDIPFRYREEGCLSIPGLRVDTKRYNYIRVKADNHESELLFTKLEAVAIQHEISHLNGRTILDDKWRKR